MFYALMAQAIRTPDQSIAALRRFRDAQDNFDEPIDEESQLRLEDLDAAIAALEMVGDFVDLPRLTPGA